MKNVTGEMDMFVGSGNVFADLGLPNPEERQLKAYLIMEIAHAIQGDGLTKKQAAQKLALSQHDLSELLDGALSDFSVNQLVSYLNCLGRDVTLSASVRKRVPETQKALPRREEQKAAVA
jgi:predicted XRE-type DNA-binding protein